MPCHGAIIDLKDVVTIKPDITIEDAMKLLNKKKLRAFPVIDDENKLVGMFSTRILLRHLLPVSVTMQDGLQRLDFILGAAPSIGKRLAKIKKEKVADYVHKNPVVLYEDTAMWEAVRLLTEYRSPMPVVDRETGKLTGLISDQSMLELLSKPIEELEAAHLK